MITDAPYALTLEAHGFFGWIVRLGRRRIPAPIRADVPLDRPWPPPLLRAIELRLPSALSAPASSSARPAIVPSIDAVRLDARAFVPPNTMICHAWIEADGRSARRELLPLAHRIGPVEENERARRLARIASADGVEGSIVEAFTNAELVSRIVAAATADTIDDAAKVGEWVCRRVGEPDAPLDPTITDVMSDPDRTRITLGSRHVLTLYRRIEAGTCAAVEVGRHLGDRLPHVPRLASVIEGPKHTVGLIQHHIDSVGDAWRFVVGEARQRRSFHVVSAKLGARTAELHLALASGAADADFEPIAISMHDQRAERQGASKSGLRGDVTPGSRPGTHRSEEPARRTDRARSARRLLVDRWADLRSARGRVCACGSRATTTSAGCRSPPTGTSCSRTWRGICDARCTFGASSALR